MQEFLKIKQKIIIMKPNKHNKCYQLTAPSSLIFLWPEYIIWELEVQVTHTQQK